MATNRPKRDGKGQQKTTDERRATHTAKYGKASKLPSRKFKNRK